MNRIPAYNCMFTDRKEAERVLYSLKELIVTYGFASVADLKDLSGYIPVSSDNRYGWFDEKSMEVRPVNRYVSGYGYFLTLPKPVPLFTEDRVLIRLKDSETPEFKSALPKAAKDDKIQKAYNVLTKALFNKDFDEDDLASAMEEAIGYLGEVLE